MTDLPPAESPRLQPDPLLPRRPGGPRGRGRWIALSTLLLGACLYLGALAVLRSAQVRRTLRDRAVAYLAARLPAARLEGTVQVDAAFRMVLGPLRVDRTGDGAPLLAVDRVTVQPRLWPLVTGGLVWGIGLSLGGPTAFALNPARDLAPRLAHALLPIHGKGGSDWGYAWVPVAGPLLGGLAAAGLWAFLVH